MPLSILEISLSRFYQIVKNRIFLKSTCRVLLKNVQDEISRPQGSWTFKKNVERFLWDTPVHQGLKA